MEPASFRELLTAAFEQCQASRMPGELVGLMIEYLPPFINMPLRNVDLSIGALVDAREPDRHAAWTQAIVLHHSHSETCPSAGLADGTGPDDELSVYAMKLAWPAIIPTWGDVTGKVASLTPALIAQLRDHNRQKHPSDESQSAADSAAVVSERRPRWVFVQYIGWEPYHVCSLYSTLARHLHLCARI